MKYLKHRRAYRMVQSISDLQLRATVIIWISPEFRDFYELMAGHKLDRLGRQIEALKKKSV